MRYLGAHPEVFVTSHKELHFFDAHFDLGLEWYESQFANAQGARQRGEGTPAYLYGDVSMRRLKATLPGARLLVILRNPVDRAYSHYWHDRARGRTTLEFEDALSVGSTMPAGPGGVVRGYLAKGHYLRFLEPLEAERAASRLHVLLFEDLRDQPESAYVAVCRYLDVDAGAVPDLVGHRLNPFVEFRSLRARRFGRRLPKALRNAVGRVNTRDRPYPPIAPGLRARLHEHFEEDNAALSDWLGRDLDVWSD